VSTRHLLTVAVAFVIGLLPWAVAAQGIDTYSAVTAARLLKPEPQNWLMYRRTYDGWGYSPPDQINTTDVHKTPSGRTLETSVYPQGPARCALEVYVPRLLTSPSS
jgi:alcohol dehydrogenase (cytochrome c)